MVCGYMDPGPYHMKEQVKVSEAQTAQGEEFRLTIESESAIQIRPSDGPLGHAHAYT